MKSNFFIYPLLIICAVLFLFWVGWRIYISYTTEKVSYQILKVIDEKEDIEIRKYPKQTYIQTKVKKQGLKQDNNTFSILAGYIFGNNQKNQKIAMTAPVISREEQQVMEMSFILPTEFNEDNAPLPNNSNIKIFDVAEKKLAAIRFSGMTGEEKVRKKKETLLKTLKQKNIKTIGKYFLYRYDDPWTPAPMRRNEVVIEVE